MLSYCRSFLFGEETRECQRVKPEDLVTTAPKNNSLWLSPALRLFSTPTKWEPYRMTLYTIDANLYGNEVVYMDGKPLLHLQTTSAAVANYCLLGRLQNCLDGKSILPTDPNSTEYLEVCLRLRRCGAVKDQPRLGWFEDDCEHALEGHLNALEHLFGWPNTYPDDSNPVWTCLIPWNSTYGRGDVTLNGGMEAHLGWEELSECNTMNDYCERLKDRGAIYYKNIADCPELVKRNLLYPSTSIKEEAEL